MNTIGKMWGVDPQKEVASLKIDDNGRMQNRRLEILYSSGWVKRWHTHTSAGEQNVGNHSWGVLMILYEIADEEDLSPAFIKSVIHHDTPEIITGDIPAPAKWNCDELADAVDLLEERISKELMVGVRELSDREKSLLKTADLLELCFYCYRQRRMGNQTMNQVFINGVNYLYDNVDMTSRARDILQDLVKSHMEASS